MPATGDARPSPTAGPAPAAPRRDRRALPGRLAADPALTWALFDGQPLAAVVTGRDGGVSTGPYRSLNLGLHVGDVPGRVIENRRRAAAALGLRVDDMVFCRQTHGRDVAVVGDADRGRGARSTADAPPCDAVVTAVPGVGIAVMVADCVPIVLYDPAAHVVAAVHAGWRGTVARIAEAAVEAMSALGADPAGILAGVGPGIAADRYQVGDDVADAARACFRGGVGHLLRPDGAGRWTFDVTAANRRVLLEAGLRPANVEISPVGTGPGTPFFSDRAVRPCGRFAALAVLRHR